MAAWGNVAPFAGAWIEFALSGVNMAAWGNVAPFAGAWIEIPMMYAITDAPAVAPFAGAWIEIVAVSGCSE